MQHSFGAPARAAAQTAALDLSSSPPARTKQPSSTGWLGRSAPSSPGLRRQTVRRIARRTRSRLKRRSAGALREAHLLVAQQRWRRHYDHVERYCQFIGFPRSGHTLIGALLNAHPDAVIGFEANALRQVRKSSDRTALFDRIMRADRRFQSLGWRWSGYDYEVKGQWQGRYRRLSVIGDKRGGGSSREIANEPELLEKLKTTVEVPTRWVVVVRNPFDNVARISTRSKLTVPEAIRRYRQVLDGTEIALEQLDPDTVHVVRIEDFVSESRACLSRAARFLGLDGHADWADACVGLVFDSPRRARDDVDWTRADRAVIESEIARSSLLSSYRF